jgi:hypothetical protein
MARAVHGTLAPNVVATENIEIGRGGIVVVNRAQTGVIWVRIDGIDPVPEADDTYAVFGAREFPSQLWTRHLIVIEVRLISDEALAYSVEAY